jgi:hypothetical protein
MRRFCLLNLDRKRIRFPRQQITNVLGQNEPTAQMDTGTNCGVIA